MKESVDKNLKEHIIKVFDHYEDSGADQGWLELRKKYTAKSSRRPVIWWSSAAAMLIFASTLLLMNTQKDVDDAIIVKNRSKAIQQDTISKNLSGLTSEQAPELKNLDISKKDIPSSLKQPAITASGESLHENLISENADLKEHIASEKPSFEETRIAVTSLNNHSQKPDINLRPVENLRTHKDQLVMQNNAITSNKSILEPQSLVAKKKPALFGDKEPRLIPSVEKVSDKSMELTFYAAPFFNYAEGSSSTMNLGAGVSSGISLSKRFTLIAGVALAKNTLVFDSEVPANSYVEFLNSTPVDQKSQNLLATSSVAQISKFEAQLLNLDIPINIKYSLSREPDKVFVTAGLSSFTYLNEEYSYSYNYLGHASNFSSGSTSNDKVINKNFGKFDLAQTLNLSFGFTHKAKVQQFVIEPFIKYPLGTLGSQDIRFGSAGINFKLSIHPTEKFHK